MIRRLPAAIALLAGIAIATVVFGAIRLAVTLLIGAVLLAGIALDRLTREPRP